MKLDKATITAQIIAALQSGPKTSADLSLAVDVDGQRLGNFLRYLLRTEQISRVEKPTGRFTYWIGLTAPGYRGYHVRPREVRPARQPMAYAMPVRHIVTPPLSGQHTNKITLPKEPWYSPTSGDCDPAQPGTAGCPVPSGVTKPQGSDRPCGVEGAA